jgi:hypothetical protein
MLIFICGCSHKLNIPELQPLLKHGDFFVGVDSGGDTYYVDYAGGILNIIVPSRTALEKYSSDVPMLLAASFEPSQIIDVGRRLTAGDEGIALGNLYITQTEIITFNFADLSFIDRQPLKKIGVTRVSNYDDFVENLNFLWEAVNDTAEYRVTIDINENPVLYRNDRIVYYENGHIFIKNTTGLFEEPISFPEFYDRFIEIQKRAELLQSNYDLHDYLCLVFRDNIYFISNSGHLIFSKGDS